MNCLDGIPGLFHFLPCLAEKEGFGTLRNECRLGGIRKCPVDTCREKVRLCRIRAAEKEGFGTLRCECRLGGIQQVSTGHLHLIVQISPSYFRQKENPIR